MRRIALLAIAVGFLMPLLASAPAHAQATRTWVSGVGDDANPCSRTAPCKTFAGAISKTAAFGEINVLDPGGFGAVTIIKSITIRSDHVEAGVLVSAGNGIVVNLPAATDRVLLEGLDIEGLNTGTNGVQMVGLGNVLIFRCRIAQFSGNGVNVAGGAGARAVIQDSLISRNAGGVNVVGNAGGVSNTAVVTRSTIELNTVFATSVTAPGTLILNGATLEGTAASIVNNGGGTVTSFINNAFTGTGTITNPVALK
jgi:Right handed beta helix region